MLQEAASSAGTTSMETMESVTLFRAKETVCIFATGYSLFMLRLSSGPFLPVAMTADVYTSTRRFKEDPIESLFMNQKSASNIFFRSNAKSSRDCVLERGRAV